VNWNFRWYFSAEVTSVFGSAFSATAIGIVGVTAFAATPAELGVISAAATVPACVLGPVAGVIGDRLRHPRRVMRLCDCVAGCAVLAVAAGIWLRIATVWWLAGLCLLLGCITTLTEVIYFTHLRGVVGPDGLTRARARLQAGEYGAGTVGQALTGVLIAALGGGIAFVVDAASYLASTLLLGRIQAPDVGAEQPADDGEPAEGFLRAAAAGLRETARHPVLRAFMGFALARSWVVGMLATLTAPFLLRALAVPEGLYGLMFAITGLLGLAGSVLAARLADRGGSRLLVLLGCGGIVASSVLLPLAQGPWPLAAGLAVLGLGLPVFFGAISNIGLNGIVTDAVAPEALGRVVANLRTLSTGAQVLGALVGGVLGGVLGLREAVWLGAATSLASGLLLFPLIRALGASRAEAASQPVADPVDGVPASAA
jgi:MFS family permease